MRPLLACALLLGAAACGADEGSSLPLGVEIHGLTATDIAAVQLTVLENAVSYNCGSLATTCLRKAVIQADGTPIADLVKLKGEDGLEHNALRFGVDAAALLSSAGQTFELKMKAGQNYLLVAEVLSKDSPAKLLASGCNVVAQVDSGDNKAVVVRSNALAAPAECAVEIN